MKLSKFLLTEQVGDDILVKQLHTGSVIALDPLSLNRLRNSDFKDLQPEDMQGLKDCGFLVEGDEDQLFRESLGDWWQNSDFLTLFVVPTNNCQCRCPYCYEDGIDRSAWMGPNACADVLAWADQYLAEHPQLKELIVVFHGGEPLLNKKAIRRLLPWFADLCDRRGIKLTVNLVSNGVLLDREILRDLSQYNLQRVQLTLDGPKAIHDQRRTLADGSGTFDTIWGNMRTAISEGFVERIHLRINIDVQNLEEVRPLLVAIKEDEILGGKVKVSLGIVSPTSGCNGQVTNAQKYIRENELTGAELARQYLSLIKIAKSLGYETYDEMMIGPWCAARHQHAWMIGPQGDVYKCACDLGRDEWRVGTIYGEVDATPILELAEKRLNECLESGCALVPICGGGCLFDLRAEPGSQCRKEFLEVVNRGLMVLQAESA